MSAPIHRVIVGTAGHIDHGKSSIVRALTGVDPDRLKEEKARGMTIDLGFAPYVTAGGRTVGIIDVPGHERFVKNMVAGASSVDIFLLVVAADDGVMPQTREHVDILELLGARQGIVVLSKIDMVDASLRELAIADVAQFLEGTPFERAPRIAVSTVTGEGMDALRAELDRQIERTAPRAEQGVFRMPIQRVFSAKGQGTVVTGVPLSGRIEIGDALEILPLGARGRVRGIQAYREERDGAAAGHSTAVNLSDVDYQSVHRGMVLCAPDVFRAVDRLEVRLKHLASAAQPLRHGSDVRVHVGTTEAIARVVLLTGANQLEPGAEGLAQLRLREPVVAARGDRFLVRLPSPMITLGGGVVVSESGRAADYSRERVAVSTRARADVLDDPAAYFEALVLDRGLAPTAQAEIPVLAKLPRAEGEALLRSLLATEKLVPIGRERFLHARSFAGGRAALLDALKRFHAANPLHTFDDGLRLRTELGVGELAFDALADSLAAAGEVEVQKGGRIRIAGGGPKLDATQLRLCEQILDRLAQAGAAPPTPAELAPQLAATPPQLAPLFKLLAERGELVKVGEFHFHRAAVDAAVAATRHVAREHQGEVAIPELRDRLKTTRKYLIPLLEMLDARGVTVRRGDKRFLLRAEASP